MKIIGVIPARYQSTRFPGKPIADICGKPMIWWVYTRVAEAAGLDGLYVATDDYRIEAVCKHYELNVMRTSDAHKTGTDRVAEVARSIDADIYINIQGDEPLIHQDMVEQVISIMIQDPSTDIATLKKEITDPAELHDRNVAKMVTDRDGKILYLSRSAIPFSFDEETEVTHYKHIGIYAYRKDFIKTYAALEQSTLEKAERIEILRALENNYLLKAAETLHHTIGVDRPENVKQVELLIKQQGGKDEL